MEALRPYWHPVCHSKTVVDAPVGVTVLGEPVVLFRTRHGVEAFHDLCPHRGAKLSLGSVIGEELTCPYHGFRYDREGTCTLIPSQPPEHQVIPSRLRLRSYRATERFGIVWIALEEPRLPVPDCPYFEDSDFHTHLPAPISWNTSAARWMENFLDMTHLAHVHPGILSDPNEPEVAPYEVEETDTGLRYEFPFRQQLDPSRWPQNPGDPLDLEDAYSRHILYLPYTISISTDTPVGTWSLWSAGLPVGPTEVEIFFVMSRNYQKDVPDEEFDAMMRMIAGQDKPIAESQHPERLPVDLTEEVHLRVGDAIGVAYRHRLREIGLRYA
ncbi:MAG: Rieske 2Fe-2S domain-containing protein [Solirubrobacterales bacterium]